MKKIILISIIALITSTSFAQNKLQPYLEIGNDFVIKIGNQLYGFEDVYRFGLFEDASWDKIYYPSVSLGISYETPSLDLILFDVYLKTDLSLNYKNHNHYLYDALTISNNIYLPVREKKKRLRMYLGIKNSLVIADFTPDFHRSFYPINRYQFGPVVLLDGRLSKNLHIGLTLYGDIKKPILFTFNEGGYRTFNAALRVSYQL